MKSKKIKTYDFENPKLIKKKSHQVKKNSVHKKYEKLMWTKIGSTIKCSKFNVKLKENNRAWKKYEKLMSNQLKEWT